MAWPVSASTLARASQAEHRRQVELSVLVSAADALALLRAIIETIEEVLKDRIEDLNKANAIFRGFCRNDRAFLPTPEPLEK